MAQGRGPQQGLDRVLAAAWKNELPVAGFWDLDLSPPKKDNENRKIYRLYGGNT
jgi:hypothetical protein